METSVSVCTILHAGEHGLLWWMSKVQRNFRALIAGRIMLFSLHQMQACVEKCEFEHCIVIFYMLDEIYQRKYNLSLEHVVKSGGKLLIKLKQLLDRI